MLDVERNGVIKLKKKIFHFTPFKPIHFKLSAIDFGSPQRHSEADLSFIPVTITRKVALILLNYEKNKGIKKKEKILDLLFYT